MDTINIVIGSWGSYNQCNHKALGSTWLTLNNYNDWEDIEKELNKQGFDLNGIDEELFIQDIENFVTSHVNWDYVHPKTLFELLKKSGVLDDQQKYELAKIFCEIEEYSEWQRRVEEHGKDWDENIHLYPDFDWYNLGRYFLLEVDCCQIPDFLENYIDFARYGEEFSYDGFHEYSNGIVEIRR